MKEIPSERPWLKEGSEVEVSSKIAKMERVWVPAMIIREIEGENSEKKYIVKSLICNGDKARPNKTVDLLSVRPIPPFICVENYQLGDYVEAFHGTVWREGHVINSLSQKRYVLLLNSTTLEFKHSDLRPLSVWEDCVWKTKESPLTQLRIHKVLSLKDRQGKKMEELECAEKVVAEKEREKVEIEVKILELQRDKEEAEKEIAQMQSYWSRA